MTSEIVFVETYTCPRCLAELQAPRGYESMWLLCPKCGRATLPPNALTPIPRSRRILDDDVLIIGPSDDERPLAPLSPLPAPKRPLSAKRVVLLVGFIISFCGLAEAFVAQESLRAALFGIATVVFVGLMTYPSKPVHH